MHPVWNVDCWKEKNRTLGQTPAVIRIIKTTNHIQLAIAAPDGYIGVMHPVEHGGFHHGVVNRITSYNVCYTKLLRPDATAGTSTDWEAVAAWPAISWNAMILAVSLSDGQF